MLRYPFGVVSVGCLILAGCGGKTMPETTPVEGVVRVNGKPQAGLRVRFLPEDRERGEGTSFYAKGLTDAQGKYVLEYDFDGQHGQGAALGPHRVIVMDTKAPPAVPNTYASPATTPLIVEVKADKKTIDLEVKK